MDLTGDWWGTYIYPDFAGPVTPFTARIEEHAGNITGTVVEPDETRATCFLGATIIGRRHGLNVDFTKIYDAGAPQEYDNPVDYVGSLSSDGNSITGVWSLLEFDGRFEMHREIAISEPMLASVGIVADF